MNPTTFKQQLWDRFEEELGKTEESPTRLYIDATPETFDDLIGILSEEKGARLATISCVDEPDQFELLYHFALDDEGFIVTLKLAVEKGENPSTETIANRIPGAEWIEREIRELFGIDFRNHPAKKRLLKADSVGDEDFPYRKDFDMDKLGDN